MRPRVLLAGIALFLAFAARVPPALGEDDYAAGRAAFDSGDGRGALAAWTPLAEGGSLRAQYSLGLLYERGLGSVSAQAGKAAHWYARAAAEGDPDARNNLARMYAEGRGVPQNAARAVALWREAAADGHTMARYNLGLSLYRGKGTEKDVAAGREQIRAAAEAGLPQAQFALGQMRRLGVGMPRDPDRAADWYGRAAAQGHGRAEQALAALRRAGAGGATGAGSAAGASGTASEGAGSEGTGRAGANRDVSAMARAAPRPAARPAPRSRNAGTDTQGAPEFRLWLGTLGSRAAARDFWERLRRRFDAELLEIQVGFETVTDGKGDAYIRLFGGAFPTRQAAETRCRRLRRTHPQVFCQVAQAG